MDNTASLAPPRRWIIEESKTSAAFPDVPMDEIARFAAKEESEMKMRSSTSFGVGARNCLASNRGRTPILTERRPC